MNKDYKNNDNKTRKEILFQSNLWKLINNMRFKIQ